MKEGTNQMSQYLNRQSRFLSPAQRMLLNPVAFSSQKAKVISKAQSGLHNTLQGFPTMTIWVECDEQPGRPVRLVGLSSIARPLSELEIGNYIAFEGSAQGTQSRGPYVAVTKFNVVTPDAQ